jgi:hypothetical protein
MLIFDKTTKLPIPLKGLPKTIQDKIYHCEYGIFWAKKGIEQAKGFIAEDKKEGLPTDPSLIKDIEHHELMIQLKTEAIEVLKSRIA